MVLMHLIIIYIKMKWGGGNSLKLIIYFCIQFNINSSINNVLIDASNIILFGNLNNVFYYEFIIKKIHLFFFI